MQRASRQEAVVGTPRPLGSHSACRRALAQCRCFQKELATNLDSQSPTHTCSKPTLGPPLQAGRVGGDTQL